MAKQNKFKEYFSTMGDIFKSYYQSLWTETDPGIKIIQHFITIAGTVALGIGAATCIASGAILPAVLLGVGAAVTTTDEAYHIVKNENPPIIASTISNILGSVVAPPLLVVGYPIALACSAVVDAFKGIKESFKERRAAKHATSDKEYTAENEATSQEATSEPTVEATHSAPDFSNYYLADEPRPTSGEYIEELEDSHQTRLEPPTTDDDPLNYD